MVKKNPTNKLSGFIALLRFELPLFAGVCVILGEILALGKLPEAKELILGFLSVFFISAAALVLNDYFDIETDKINAPHRALASGRVSKREALVFFGILSFAGIVVTGFINIESFLLGLLVWIVGVLYNWRFKLRGLSGNLLVSFSVGMTFVFGSFVVGIVFEPTVLLFAIIAALFDLGEEITGDALDIEGDLKKGSRSLAVKFGPEKALRIGLGIFIFMIFISIIPFVLGWLNPLYGIPIFLMDVGVLFFSIKLIGKPTEKRRKYLRYNYMFAGSMLIVFLILRLVLK